MSSAPETSPPSTAAIALATGILCALSGYLVGQASSLGLFGNSTRKSGAKSSWPNSYDVNIHPDSSDEEPMKSFKGNEAPESEDDESEDEDQGELKTFVDNKEECKLVLVVRRDLGMTKGKIAAQCSHATLACYTYFMSHAPNSPILKRWRSFGQAKVAVQCKSEEELLTLQAQALSLGLCAQIIHDAGRTQIASGSATVLGVGPGPKGVVDQVTGGLKLL
ncbi:hypothetical protein MMC30_001246 [Trapelia coarctata]|nr:hypothetical protein [Trapelia coarctata]